MPSTQIPPAPLKGGPGSPASHSGLGQGPGEGDASCAPFGDRPLLKSSPRLGSARRDVRRVPLLPACPGIAPAAKRSRNLGPLAVGAAVSSGRPHERPSVLVPPAPCVLHQPQIPLNRPQNRPPLPARRRKACSCDKVLGNDKFLGNGPVFPGGAGAVRSPRHSGRPGAGGSAARRDAK